MWLFTVASLITSFAAIAGFGRPFAEAEHFGLPGGQAALWPGWLLRPGNLSGDDGVDKVMLDGGIDHSTVVEHLMERLADLRSAGVLGQVAAGAGPERLDDRTVIGVCGQGDHLDAG